MTQEKGEYVAVREMRKHIAMYVKGIYRSADIKRRVNEMENENDIVKLLNEYRMVVKNKPELK